MVSTGSTTAPFNTVALNAITPSWTPATPLRRAIDRRQALVEIDALVAIALGITADELAQIYLTQFPVLVGYDRKDYVYDANGRLMPNQVLTEWRKRDSGRLSLSKPPRTNEFPAELRTVTHPGSGIAYTYELPFRLLNREADLRSAHHRFTHRLAEQLRFDVAPRVN